MRFKHLGKLGSCARANQFSRFGRIVTAACATVALGLGMTACGSSTVGYMWVLGTYYNQISGFRIDNYTGNLTPVNNSPFTARGNDPVSIVVNPGGRFVFVIDAGTPTNGAPGSPTFVAPVGSGVNVYAVGGTGILTYQSSATPNGTTPVWAVTDTSGGFLYVLTKYSPNYDGVADLNGALTVFRIDGSTGQLTVVPNLAVKVGLLPTYFYEVGPNPIMTKTAGSGCLYTLSSNEVFPYAIGSAGQLTPVPTGAYVDQNVGQYSSINTGGSNGFIFMTDIRADKNNILTYTSGTGCVLSPVSAAQTQNLPGATLPINSLTSANGSFLYVLNQGTPANPQQNGLSNISAFNIDSAGRLTPLAGTGTDNPYPVGSGPVCLAQDPTQKYMYISNSGDNTVSGKRIDLNRGFLNPLPRSSVFPTSQTPSCLAISGSL